MRCEAGGDTENIRHYLSLPGRSSDYLQVASPEIAERRRFVTEPSVNILSPAPHSQSRQTATLHGVTQCYMLHAAAVRNIKQLTCAECGCIYLSNL